MGTLKRARSTSRALRDQLTILVVVLALMLGGGFWIVDRMSTSLDQLAVSTATARRQVEAAGAIISALRDAETGQRGYLLTTHVEYLAPYLSALGTTDALLDRLKTVASGVPSLQAELAPLTTAVRKKMAEMQQTIITAQRDGFPAAVAIVNTDAGKQSMDDARAIIGRILAQADADRLSRAAGLLAGQRSVTQSLLAVLGTGLLSLGLTSAILLWKRSRLLVARAGEQRQAARLQAAIEHVPDGVAVFDGDARLTLANTRFAATIGVDAGLAVPGTPYQDIAAAIELDPPLLAGPRPATPLTAEARAGKRTLDVWRSPMPDGGQMLSVADVTQRVDAEEAARQSQKMEVLGQMTGGVAHDFNNLLQVVSANLELLRSRLERDNPDPSLLARLDAATGGVARGARLTRHLLAFARRQPLAPEPIDTARLLTGIEEMIRRTLGEAIQLELVVGGGLWFMRADPGQVENALLNLALNARDAMAGPDGMPTGKLTIEAANASFDEAYAARRSEVSPGQYVMFAVTDTGTGMTPDQLARAVEPFYTTKAEGRGTGLGLSMVLGFAKQSGGHFQLYSEPGKGTTARLYIPRSSAPAARADAPSGGLPLGRNELVLLVEDDEAVRLVSREALQGLGYAVIEAETADAAMALLEFGARPSLLFTDVVMPGKLTARQLAAGAKAIVPGLAVLFTSGYTQNSIVHNGQLDPDVAMISKPWRREDLARALRNALEGTAIRPPPRRRVLLVEDEELVRMTTADALAELGFDVMEASSAAGALARLHPPPDLLLTDFSLPDQDGLALVSEVRRHIAGLPAVIASGLVGTTSDEIVWLNKPYDIAALRKAVTEALPEAVIP